MSNDTERAIEEYDKLIERACRLLPAWFVPRMMEDNWFFGLLLVTGHVLCVACINDVQQAADGTIWIDADMLADVPGQSNFAKHIISPTSRVTTSINAAHVVMALELADT